MLKPYMADNPIAQQQEAAHAQEQVAEQVAAVLRGEHAQFQPLIEAHQQPIFGYLYRLLNRDRDAAQDLTQTVFLKAFQGLASFDTRRPLRPWLYRIAHNEAANYLRGRSRAGEVPIEEQTLHTLHDPNGLSPEEEMTGDSERRMVLDALATLPPDYRDVLVLHFFEDKSYAEIAEIRGSNTNSVGTLIRRGKERLRTMLEGLEGQHDA